MARMRGALGEEDGVLGADASSRNHEVIPLREGVVGSERWFARPSKRTEDPRSRGGGFGWEGGESLLVCGEQLLLHEVACCRCYRVFGDPE
jgi:hypothetical protein